MQLLTLRSFAVQNLSSSLGYRIPVETYTNFYPQKILPFIHAVGLKQSYFDIFSNFLIIYLFIYYKICKTVFTLCLFKFGLMLKLTFLSTFNKKKIQNYIIVCAISVAVRTTEQKAEKTVALLILLSKLLSMC